MNKAYALSDLHGRYDLLQKIMNFLDEDDIVIFLGDAADRGPRGYDCMKGIWEDERFEYMLGNHEDMTAAALKEYNRHGHPGWDYQLSVSNGGSNTLYDIISNDEITEWIERINKMSPYMEYVNDNGQKVILNHSGYCTFEKGNMGSIDNILWDRSWYIPNKWDINYLIENNVYIVHGHTPRQSLEEELESIAKINGEKADYVSREASTIHFGGHAYCIDNYAVGVGQICLLDLDTFEEIIFTDEDDE